MGELKRRLDAEARRMAAREDALDRVQHRAERRRVARQFGTGTLALAVAAGGFALAATAFSGPGTRPQVGPSLTPSLKGVPVVVAAPQGMEAEADRLASWLADAGYDVEVRALTPDEVPSHTIVGYAVDVREEAEEIIRRFLPGVSATGTGYPGSRPSIEIRLAPSDYPEVTIRVRLIDGSGLEGATRAAATILSGEGYFLLPLREMISVEYTETFITCAPGDEAAAQRIRQSLFPKAEIRAQLPDEDHDVTLHIGPDFYDDYAGLNPGAASDPPG